MEFVFVLLLVLFFKECQCSVQTYAIHPGRKQTFSAKILIRFPQLKSHFLNQILLVFGMIKVHSGNFIQNSLMFFHEVQKIFFSCFQAQRFSIKVSMKESFLLQYKNINSSEYSDEFYTNCSINNQQ